MFSLCEQKDTQHPKAFAHRLNRLNLWSDPLPEAALRPLGQEALRRRGELTPDESHRIHTAYQACGKGFGRLPEIISFVIGFHFLHVG